MAALKMFTKCLKRTGLWAIVRPVYLRWEIVRWRMKGKPGPLPRLLKQKTLRQYAQDYRLDTFVETGTYEGDMVASQLGTFAKIHTIELDPVLYRQAMHRFAHQPHVEVHCGDSGELLPQLVAKLIHPALFWLDAHYSSGITARAEVDTPILKELRAVLESPVRHLVLIDDARHFNGRGDYPSIDTLRSLLCEIKPNYMIDVQDDIIRLWPCEE